MRRHLPMIAVALATAAAGAMPATAGATSAFADLVGIDGDGSFDDRLACGDPENGQGDTWRYVWEDGPATSTDNVLAGSWNGSFEVHDAGGGKAFVPNRDGRISIQLGPSSGRSGTAFFDTLGDGGCGNADLVLTPLDSTDPTAQNVTGDLPIEATGGTGALRGLTGSGTVNLDLDLTAGADNPARVLLDGAFDVLDPVVTVSGATARWDNTTNYLNRRLTVLVTLRNASGAGDAFGVRVTSASGGTGWFEGLPAGNATIPQGGGATFRFTMRNASANRVYTVGVKAGLRDGLLAEQPPVSGSVTFRAPALP